MPLESSRAPLAKRQLMYIPAIHPASFLLFFHKGSNPGSWSVRDYSQPGRVEVRYADEFGWDVAEVARIAQQSISAPTVPTTNLGFWHGLTLEKNAQFGLAGLPEPPAAGLGRGAGDFPLLAEQELLSLDKARKQEDLRRIRKSRNSEDWVTWNFLHLLQDIQPQMWWRTLNEATSRFNPRAGLDINAGDEPRLVFWSRVASPVGYERLSRERMSESGKSYLVRRAHARSPVEGDSEIDVTFESRRCLVYVEAKLGSDVSARTLYDSARNQIARNIDCVLEEAGGREPAFWMLVRDTEPDRMYVQLINQYRSDPQLLMRDLPHRSEPSLRRIAERLAIIRWCDLGADWIQQASANPLTESVRLELLRRI